MGVIELLGDRKNSGFCINCGTDLLIPWNDYQCCVECTRFLVGISKKAENNKEKSRKVGKCVISSRAIFRQRKPIGGIPTE